MFGCEGSSKTTRIHSVLLLFDTLASCSCCRKHVFLCGLFVESTAAANLVQQLSELARHSFKASLRLACQHGMRAKLWEITKITNLSDLSCHFVHLQLLRSEVE